MTHSNTYLQRAADFLRTVEETLDHDALYAAAYRQQQINRWNVLQTLHHLQRYRRGQCSFEDMGYTPKQIGLAIDFCIKELRKHFRPL